VNLGRITNCGQLYPRRRRSRGSALDPWLECGRVLYAGAHGRRSRYPAARMPFWPTGLALSPDGGWIALPLRDNGTANIWAIPTDGGAYRQVTNWGTPNRDRSSGVLVQRRRQVRLRRPCRERRGCRPPRGYRFSQV